MLGLVEAFQEPRCSRARVSAPVIMHLDMDAFFVNVELLQKPELRGRSLIVARKAPRSVVTSASYEARRYGVRSAMPLARALQLCPESTVIEPASDYGDYSRRVMAILQQITDRVEQVSIDEAFVDLTGAIRGQGSPVFIAQKARQKIAAELKLPSSVGIASTKLVAKMASAASKPQGLWLIPPHKVQDFLDPLQVDRLWGVGAKTAAQLHGWGIHTIEDLRGYQVGWLQKRFGRSTGAHLYDMSRGIDRRTVASRRVEKSIGAEHTFGNDQQEAHVLMTELYALCLSVAQRLRASGKHTRSLSLKIRYSNFETLTRSCPLPVATSSGRQMFEVAFTYLVGKGLVDTQGNSLRPVRLLGVRAEKLEEQSAGVQLALLQDNGELGEFDRGQHWEQAERAMDRVQRKFGPKGLSPARLLLSNTASNQRQ